MARSSLLLPLALGLAACKTGSIKVGDGDGDGGDGGAATCPNLAVDTSEVDFGAMAYGEAVTRTIVVQNDCAGSGDLDVLAALSGDPLFTGGLAPVTLSPGDSATFDVTFTADDYDAHCAQFPADPICALDYPVFVEEVLPECIAGAQEILVWIFTPAQFRQRLRVGSESAPSQRLNLQSVRKQLESLQQQA